MIHLRLMLRYKQRQVANPPDTGMHVRDESVSSVLMRYRALGSFAL